VVVGEPFTRRFVGAGGPLGALERVLAVRVLLCPDTSPFKPLALTVKLKERPGARPVTLTVVIPFTFVRNKPLI